MSVFSSGPEICYLAGSSARHCFFLCVERKNLKSESFSVTDKLLPLPDSSNCNFRVKEIVIDVVET